MFLIRRQVWFTNSMIPCSSSSLKIYVLHRNDAFAWFVSTWSSVDDNYNWIRTMFDPWLSTLSCPFKNSKMPTKPFLNQGWKLEAWFIHECGLNCDCNEDKCKYNSKRLTGTRISPRYEKLKVLKSRLRAYRSPIRGPYHFYL